MDYQKFLNESLIEFVKKVLTKVQYEGLQGEHHFYLSFVTNDPQVHLSSRMKKYYPKEITIVLQNQFEDLEVNPDSFSVKLSFNHVPETIVVPFRCLTSFTDPSVNFNLQFKHDPLIMDSTISNKTKDSKKPNNNSKPESAKVEKLSSNVIVLDKFRNKNQPS